MSVLVRKQGEQDTYLEDLSIGVQRVDGDLYVPRHALSSLLELALLQRYVEIISHLTFKRTTYVEKNGVKSKFNTTNWESGERLVSNIINYINIYVLFIFYYTFFYKKSHPHRHTLIIA